MIVKLVILHPLPADEAAFQAAYVEEHLPGLLAKLPGLTGCVLSKSIWTVAGERPFFVMTEIYFPSLEALQTALPAKTAQDMTTYVAHISQLDVPVMVVCMEEVFTAIRGRADRWPIGE